MVRGNFHDLPLSFNSLRTAADFTPVQIYNPVDGSPLTIYNVSAAKASAVSTIDTSSSDLKKAFVGYTVGFNVKLPHGASAFGGFNTERIQYNSCVQPNDPNLLRQCDDSQNQLPFQPSLKVSGAVPVKWGVVVSGSYQNLQGYNAGVDGHTTGAPSYGSAFVITRSTKYPSNCPAPCPAGELVFPSLTLASLTVPLQPYASVFTERLNEVELRISKSIHYNRMVVEPRLEIFNLLNRDTATAWRSVNYGTSSYLQPSAVPPARFVGIGIQVKF
jgi:hypothetical protein